VTRLFQFARLRRLLESPWAKYFVVAFGLPIRIVTLARIGGRFLYYENTAYERMAVQLLHNVNFSPYWPPGVPYYLMLAHMLFGEGLLVARASILIVYVAFSFGLYALVRELWSLRAANIALLIFVLYPSYIRWSFNPSTEYPAAACLVAIVWLTAVTIRKRSVGAAVALGLLIGILALVRGSSIGLVILIPVFLFCRTRRFMLALVPLLIAAIPISAWLWKAHDMTGRFVMINESNAENFFQSNNAYTRCTTPALEDRCHGMWRHNWPRCSAISNANRRHNSNKRIAGWRSGTSFRVPICFCCEASIDSAPSSVSQFTVVNRWRAARTHRRRVDGWAWQSRCSNSASIGPS
jgi:4-amino-4-deoxy-L-arabinose transferase-like glycosyltransferase